MLHQILNKFLVEYRKKAENSRDSEALEPIFLIFRIYLDALRPKFLFWISDIFWRSENDLSKVHIQKLLWYFSVSSKFLLFMIFPHKFLSEIVKIRLEIWRSAWRVVSKGTFSLHPYFEHEKMVI